MRHADPKSSRLPEAISRSLFILAVLLTFSARAARAGEVAVAPAGPAATGMKVNVDPATGRFLETPAPVPVAPASGRAPAPAPVVMEASPVAGGGQGFRVSDQRFDSEIKATTTPGEEAGIRCGTAAR